MQDILNLIENRRSIRKYNSEPLDRDTVNKIVEAGRWAPTGGNCQTVHFTVVSNGEVLEELRHKVKDAFAAMELTEDLYASLKNSIRLSQSGNYIYDYNAPVLVIVSNVKGYANAIADSACALENMMLAATALGVGSCWINQLHWLDENDDIRHYLSQYGISADETICGALALGHHDVPNVVKPRIGMPVTYVD